MFRKTGKIQSLTVILYSKNYVEKILKKCLTKRGLMCIMNHVAEVRSTDEANPGA